MFLRRVFLSEIFLKREIHDERLLNLYSGYWVIMEVPWILWIVSMGVAIDVGVHTPLYGSMLILPSLVSIYFVFCLIRARKWVRFMNKHPQKSKSVETRHSIEFCAASA
jgi:uncharacterized membrane protein